MIKICSVCHSEFTCGVQQGGQSCWCNSFPAIMPAEFIQDCRCPSCLAKAIAKHIDAVIKTNTLKQNLDIASAYRTDTSLREHIDYQIEHGQYVFRKWYHLKRGNCCGHGCKNCPY